MFNHESWGNLPTAQPQFQQNSSPRSLSNSFTSSNYLDSDINSFTESESDLAEDFAKLLSIRKSYRIPPPSYMCHLCFNETGNHYIRDCPKVRYLIITHFII